MFKKFVGNIKNLFNKNNKDNVLTISPRSSTASRLTTIPSENPFNFLYVGDSQEVKQILWEGVFKGDEPNPTLSSLRKFF